MKTRDMDDTERRVIRRKRTIILAALLFLALALCATGVLAEPLTGGWESVPQEAVKLPAEAQAAFDRATDGFEGARYIPAALLSTQVVAGKNYCILCQVIPETAGVAPSWALVYIYADLRGSAEITNVYELYIDRHSAPAK